MNAEKYIDDTLNKDDSKKTLEDMERDRTEKAREKLNNNKDNKKEFNQKIKAKLLYSGAFGAGISVIAYIIITFVIVNGFTTALELSQQILFSILGAVAGLSITISLRLQGITFAKKEEDSIKIMQAYYKVLNKTKTKKKLHTINHFMAISTIRDILIKGLTVAIYTWFILYIFIEGNGNTGLIWLAIANSFMFVGFGLIALSSAYDKYIDEHLPVIEELTAKMIAEETEKNKEKEKGE